MLISHIKSVSALVYVKHAVIMITIVNKGQGIGWLKVIRIKIKTTTSNGYFTLRKHNAKKSRSQNHEVNKYSHACVMHYGLFICEGSEAYTSQAALSHPGSIGPREGRYHMTS